MKNARMIALSSVTTALAVTLLTLGNWFPTLSLSGAFMASLVMMIPLAKNSTKGALFSFFATVILTGVFSGFFTRWDALLPFAIFSGLHPTVNYYFGEKHFFKRPLGKVLFILIKDVWFVGALVLTQLLVEVYTGEVEFIRRYLYPILIVAGALIFPLYDLLMTRFQRMTIIIIKRFKL